MASRPRPKTPKSLVTRAPRTKAQRNNRKRPAPLTGAGRSDWDGQPFSGSATWTGPSVPVPTPFPFRRSRILPVVAGWVSRSMTVSAPRRVNVPVGYRVYRRCPRGHSRHIVLEERGPWTDVTSAVPVFPGTVPHISVRVPAKEPPHFSQGGSFTRMLLLDGWFRDLCGVFLPARQSDVSPANRAVLRSVLRPAHGYDSGVGQSWHRV